MEPPPPAGDGAAAAEAPPDGGAAVYLEGELLKWTNYFGGARARLGGPPCPTT